MSFIIALVITVHMASSNIIGVMITFIPQVIQLVTLGYAFVHIRASLVQLSEAANMFVANEIRMYT